MRRPRGGVPLTIAVLLTIGCGDGGTGPTAGGTEFIYVAETVNATNPFRLLVLDPATGYVVRHINLTAIPYAVALTPDGEYAYVSTSIRPLVEAPPVGGYLVVDTRSGREIAFVEVGQLGWAVAVSPDGHWAYLADAIDSTLSVIETAVFQGVSQLFSRGTNGVVASIELPGAARGLAFSATGARAYVTLNDDHVAVIDAHAHEILTEIPVGSIPYLLEATPDGRLLYVANFGSNDVTVIDLATNDVMETVDVAADGGMGPYGVAITPDGAFAYISNFTSDNVSVIEVASNTVVATINVENVGTGIAMAPDGQHVYVTGGDTVTSVIETASNTVVGIITTDGYTRGAAAPMRN
jgi:YVTN family beta-propeller protein